MLSQSMPSSEPFRVFISYARKDGAVLAHRLQSDLAKQNFDAWLDKRRIAGGATWTKEIEAALDEAEYVLALMTSGSYVSEICRAEQLRALRKGKCVIPLMAQRDAEVPLHLETKNYRDFTADSRYAQAFTEVLSDLHTRNGVPLRREFQQTYVTAPPLTVNFVERPEALAALRDALITDDGGYHIALTALEGMGGIGKTVLAQALCHDEVVQQAFPDGVIWITVGKESTFDTLTRMREVGKALGDDLSRYDNELGAKNQYRSTIRSKAALIVVDDIWSPSDLEPLRAESSPRSRLLFTTRDTSIASAVGAREHIAELLTEEKSREMFARWSGTEIEKLPPLAKDLIQECGKLPLALSMVGAMLRGRPPVFWKSVLDHLRKADLDKIRAQFPDYPYTDVLRAIQVSVDLLDPTAREHYIALGVLLEEMAAAPQVQQCIWGVDENKAAEIAEEFVGLSLAQRDQSEGSIRLHDLQLDYLRARHPDKKALDLIHGAIRLSSHVIEGDPAQFASQMIGRLLSYQDLPAVEEFTKRVGEGTRAAWLRPLQPALHPPGTALIRTLTGHTSSLYAVAVTPDGQRAVSASGDETLKVWDLGSGRELHTLTGHTSYVTAVAVTPDGQRAVSASWDRTLKVWDLGSGRELHTLTGHTDRVTAVIVTPDGQRAVSASEDRRLKVWDLGSVRELHTLTGHKYSVTAVAVTPDGQRAVSASGDRTLKVWDLGSGRELHTLSGHTDRVTAVIVTPDGQRAVSASGDRTLKVWDLGSGRELHTLTGHASDVNAVAVTLDAERAVSASGDQTLKVWDLGSGRELHTLSGHTNYITAAAVTPDGQRAVSASYDETLKVWDLASGRELHTLTGHTDRVTAVAVTPDGQRAVSASRDRTMKVWDLGGVRGLHTLTGHTSRVTAVAMTPDGQRAVSASYDEMLKVWDLGTGRELHTLTGHTHFVDAVAVTPDGQRAVSASADETLKVWDLGSGRELHTLTGHTGRVTAVAVTPGGQRAVSASADRTLKVWDLGSGRELHTLTGHTNYVTAVAVTPDGQRAVSASADRTLKVWDLGSVRELHTLTGHTDRVTAVAVTPDGQRAVSASRDQTLKLWDLGSVRELQTLTGHTNYVTAVAVTPDGQRAVSASRDQTLKLWDLETEEVLATFSCDIPAFCCAFSEPLKLILAGDAGGHLHVLHLEAPKPKN
jgi:WD40 repeat protein